jgi:hypothetical protein
MTACTERQRPQQTHDIAGEVQKGMPEGGTA